MYKLVSLVVLLLIGFQLSAQNSDQILWHSSTKLSWSDFKGKPIPNHFAAALTKASTQFHMKYEDGEFKIDTRVYFIKSGSWVKTKGKTDYLLKHEQTHFDLFELYARKLRKDLMELDASIHPKKLSKLMVKAFKKNKKAMLKAQKLYDKETHHSINEGPQARWNEKVEQELKRTYKYSHPYLTIKSN